MIRTGRRWRVWLAAPAVSITIGAALGLAACGVQPQPGKQAGGLPSKSAGSGPTAGNSAKGGQLTGAQATPASGGGGGIVNDPAAYQRAVKSGDWEGTPTGLVNKSCIYSVPNNATVENGEIILPSGAKEKMKPCSQPTLANPGGSQGGGVKPGAVPAASTVSAPGKAAQPSVGAGPCRPLNTDYWAGSCYTSSTWLEQMWERYTVPAKPAKAGALIFLWGGLEDTAGRDVIQDVLTWGANGSIETNSNGWYITPWYVSNGGEVHGKSIKVKPGQTMDTLLDATSCRSDGTHCHWGLVITDLSTHQTTEFFIVSYQSFRTVLGAVAEIYDATNCSEMPANGYAAFRRLSLVNKYGKTVAPSFGVGYPGAHCNVRMVHGSVWANILWST